MSHLYSQLDFPLNVFAHSLYLQEGQVEYLHYGLFKESESLSDTLAHEAQQRSTELLLSYLPPPPCRILEIGIGLGTTAIQLAQRGYTVTGITPDAGQIALAEKSKAKALSEFKAEALSESKAEALLESKAEALSESKAEALSESKAEALLESKAEALSEFKAEALSESKAEALLESKAEALNDNVNFENVTFEAFAAQPASYDVILLQEVAQYIPSLTLFNKAHELLAKDGTILMADEIAKQRTSTDVPHSLPLLSSTIAQAQRCGFEVKEQQDLSRQAAPSVDYLLWVIEQHRERLSVDLDLASIVLDELLNSLRGYQQNYHQGTYGYVLLNFIKTQSPRWKITFVTANEKNAVKALFSEVCQPEEMSDALWEWKYGDSRGLGIAGWYHDKMVAHYGGIRREIRYFGQAKPAVQIADVMVSPKERAVLTRKGAFFVTAATFPECYVGYGAPILLGYGFPNDRAMKVAERLGLYAPVGKIIELHWSTILSKSHLWTRIRHLHPLESETEQSIINQLWQKMAVCLQNALVGVRDWDYIHHRYLKHPHFSYELLLVTRRLTGQALGIAIIHRLGDTCRLMDFIGDLAHIPEVIKQVQRMAGIWGMKTVTTWITANFSHCFPLTDAEQKDIKVQIPHSIWTDGISPKEIDGHWWLMIGDTDFL
jgi:cyclopropane fatty-acyl-phospholipid synthase-like methyltransferase